MSAENILSVLIAVALLIVFVLAFSYLDSKYEKLSPPGKYSPSYRVNLRRNAITFSVIFGLIYLIRYVF